MGSKRVQFKLMSNLTTIEMFVVGLVIDPSTQAPIVILKDETGQYALPIWIGVAEATSIAAALEKITSARPLGHDLMYQALLQLNVKIERVIINDLKESTYYSELILMQGDKAMVLDARPSDAIAIALRAQAPIFVAQHVLDQARMAFSPPASMAGQEKGEEELPPQEANLEDKFVHMDKEKWAKLLEELSPADFKYKM